MTEAPAAPAVVLVDEPLASLQLVDVSPRDYDVYQLTGPGVHTTLRAPKGADLQALATRHHAKASPSVIRGRSDGVVVPRSVRGAGKLSKESRITTTADIGAIHVKEKRPKS